MNITPQFVNSPDFVLLKRKIGTGSLEYLVRLGCNCQQLKTSICKIRCAEEWSIISGCEDGGKLKDALIELDMVEDLGNKEYEFHFFADMNNQLLSNWKNGQLKSKQSKAKQSKPNQPKSTQLNSTECLGTAKAVDKHCLTDEERFPFGVPLDFLKDEKLV